MSSAVLNSPLAPTPKRSFREQMHLAREDAIVTAVAANTAWKKNVVATLRPSDGMVAMS